MALNRGNHLVKFILKNNKLLLNNKINVVPAAIVNSQYLFNNRFYSNINLDDLKTLDPKKQNKVCFFMFF